MANMIIKPAVGGNLLIQDRAGGAVLSTSTSGATIANATLTTPTIASMANCTFPAGHITNAFIFTDTSSGTLNQNGTTSATVACDPFAFSAISGRKYIISGSQHMSPYRLQSSSNIRWQHNYLYLSTTDRTFASTTGPGSDTLLFHGPMGRYIVSSNSADGPSYGDFSYEANFTAGSTATYYFYTAIAPVDTSTARARAYNSAQEPHNASVLEIMV